MGKPAKASIVLRVLSDKRGISALLTNRLIASDRGEACYVYVICGGTRPVKIGIGIHPRSRLSSLQVGSPFRLQIYDAVPVPYAVAYAFEQLIHRKFASFRLEGEWFDLDPNVAARAIRSLTVGFSRKRWKLVCSCGHIGYVADEHVSNHAKIKCIQCDSLFQL